MTADGSTLNAVTDTSSFALFAFEASAVIERAETASALREAVDAAFSWAQAEVVTCLAIRSTPAGPDVSVGFGRTTPAWKEQYCETGLLNADPLVRHALTSSEAAAWSDFDPHLPAAAAPHVDSRARARALGFTEAVICPRHRPGGAAGAVLIMTRAHGPYAVRQRQALGLLSAALHSASRRLGLGGGGGGSAAPRLTRREAEALFWAAGGAKDKEIAAAMSLSPTTVTSYMHEIQKKLGVRGRVRAAQRPLTAWKLACLANYKAEQDLPGAPAKIGKPSTLWNHGVARLEGLGHDLPRRGVLSCKPFKNS